MNYRHAFHAGNHGDVLKHVVLTRILAYLTQKAKPLAVLDAHAGIGSYDLAGVEAFKTGEWRDGIGKLAGEKVDGEAGRLLEPYLSLIARLNAGGPTQRYPGSPVVAQALLRATDRLIVNELHPQDHALLAARLAGDGRVRVTQVDALQAVKAELPFAERRGLVLIDPAYEVAHETVKVGQMVQQALARQSTVCVAVWYPVTTRAFADGVVQAVAAAPCPDLLQVELMVREPGAHQGLAGSGMLVVNAPWLLKQEMDVVLPTLAQRLGKGRWGQGRVAWLKPPT